MDLHERHKYIVRSSVTKAVVRHATRKIPIPLIDGSIFPTLFPCAEIFLRAVQTETAQALGNT